MKKDCFVQRVSFVSTFLIVGLCIGRDANESVCQKNSPCLFVVKKSGFGLHYENTKYDVDSEDDRKEPIIVLTYSSEDSEMNDNDFVEEMYEGEGLDFLDEINNNDTSMIEVSSSIPLSVLIGAAFKMLSFYCCEVPLQRIKQYYGVIIKPELKKQWNYYTVQKNEEKE